MEAIQTQPLQEDSGSLDIFEEIPAEVDTPTVEQVSEDSGSLDAFNFELPPQIIAVSEELDTATQAEKDNDAAFEWVESNDQASSSAEEEQFVDYPEEEYEEDESEIPDDIFAAMEAQKQAELATEIADEGLILAAPEEIIDEVEEIVEASGDSSMIVEETVAEVIQEQPQEIVEEIVEETVAESVEEIIEKPEEEIINEPIEVTVDEAVAEIIDEPVEEIVEESKDEELVETPVEEVVEEISKTP